MNLKALRILVPVKRVIDSNIRITVSRGTIDATGLKLIDPDDINKHSLNPFDSIAVEEALRLKALVPGSNVTAVTIGGKKSLEVLQTALGMGAERALHVLSDNDSLMPLTVARALARIVEQNQYDLIIAGKQAIDGDYGQTGSMLSAILDWPQASFARKVVLNPESMSLTVTTETDTGLRVVEVSLPAVLITDLGLNTPRYVSLANMIKAKKKPVDCIPLSDLKIEESPTLKIDDIYSPPPRPRCKFVNSVDELMEKLRQEKIF